MDKPIAYYDADGKPRGFRTLEAARRLLANEVVTACYGRKGHIKAIFLRKADGSNVVQAEITGGTHYSFREHFDCGRVAWSLKRLGKGDELRPIFLAVVADCMAKS